MLIKQRFQKSELGLGLSLGFMDVGFEGEWITPSNNSGADDPSVPAMGKMTSFLI